MELKKVKKLISLSVLTLMIANVAVMTKVEARMLEDWEIGIHKNMPEAEKQQKRSAYLYRKADAEYFYLGEWINTKTNRVIGIDQDYWGGLQYTYKSTHRVATEPNRRIFYVDIEGKRAIVYFDVRHRNEFTVFIPERKETTNYIRKQ